MHGLLRSGSGRRGPPRSSHARTRSPRSELRFRGGIRRWFFGYPQAGRARLRSARPLVCRWRQSRAEPAPDRKRVAACWRCQRVGRERVPRTALPPALQCVATSRVRRKPSELWPHKICGSAQIYGRLYLRVRVDCPCSKTLTLTRRDGSLEARGLRFWQTS